MKETLLNKELLKTAFESIENPFEALKVKENIEFCLQYLKVPSPELLEMLKKEGFAADMLAGSAVQNSKPQKNSVNIENRSFLVEGDIPTKILHGRAVSSEIDKGNQVIKFVDLSEKQKEIAFKLGNF